MKVLILGAGGYIGSEVAKALRSRGHSVYGLIRTKSSASRVSELKRNEIIPVLGAKEDPTTWQVLNEVNVVIDATGPSADPSSNQIVLSAISNASKQTGNKKRFIFTSGGAVYGTHPKAVTENDETRSIPFKWRADLDRQIIGSSDFEGVVLRPSFVYGKSATSIGNLLFKVDTSKPPTVRGNPTKPLPLVHVDDLAHAFVLTVEAPSAIVAGQIFNVQDNSTYTFEQGVLIAARAAGATGRAEYVPAGTDPWSQFIETTLTMSNEKIRRVLGWHPVHPPLLQEIDTYYQAWAEAQKQEQQAL